MNLYSKNIALFSKSICALVLLLSLQSVIASEIAKIRYDSPVKTAQGTCIPLYLQSDTIIEYPMASFKDSSNRAIARCEGTALPGELYTYLILLPVPTDAREGTASIHVTGVLEGRPFAKIIQVEITKFNFVSETIALNPTNTAIKTDTSVTRMDQINTLNEILNTSRPDAYVFLGPWDSPVKATRRTSLFGDQRIYKYSNGTQSTSVHWGIDFGVPTGTAVFAAGDGIVVMACERISTGLTIVIEHMSGVYSLYYHLDALLTSEGEQVRTGTLIARSGSTGLSTGPHLHWEFRVATIAVSPDWFTGKTFFYKAVP